MNWTLGFRRLAAAILALVWVLFVGASWDADLPRIERGIFFMVIFSIGYGLLYAALEWIARGFFARR